MTKGHKSTICLFLFCLLRCCWWFHPAHTCTCRLTVVSKAQSIHSFCFLCPLDSWDFKKLTPWDTFFKPLLAFNTVIYLLKQNTKLYICWYFLWFVAAMCEFLKSWQHCLTGLLVKDNTHNIMDGSFYTIYLFILDIWAVTGLKSVTQSVYMWFYLFIMHIFLFFALM